MSDFGGKLRLARERRGISLRQIATSTKISAAALEALERNDVSKLPGGIFSRAFVRSYAVEVGLDPDETVREFLDRFQGEPSQSGPVNRPTPESESQFESQQRMASMVLKLVLISIPIAGGIVYFTLKGRSVEQATPPPTSVGPAAASPAVQPPGDAPAPPAFPTPTATPSVPSKAASSPAIPAPKAVLSPGLPAPKAASSPAVPTPAPAPAAGSGAVAPAALPTSTAANTMALELRATGQCWVRLTVDGRRQVARVMQAGETTVHQVRDTAVIEVGDAGAFEFSVDGRAAKPLGTAGQVKIAKISRGTLAQYLQ
jgi:cytoskeleton protein RodZ